MSSSFPGRPRADTNSSHACALLCSRCRAQCLGQPPSKVTAKCTHEGDQERPTSIMQLWLTHRERSSCIAPGTPSTATAPTSPSITSPHPPSAACHGRRMSDPEASAHGLCHGRVGTSETPALRPWGHIDLVLKNWNNPQLLGTAKSREQQFNGEAACACGAPADQGLMSMRALCGLAQPHYSFHSFLQCRLQSGPSCNKKCKEGGLPEPPVPPDDGPAELPPLPPATM